MDRVVQFEIPARDLDRAKKFYSTVFGWRTFDWQNKPYTSVYTAETDDRGQVRENGAINGQIVERNKNVPNPVIAIQVKSLEESVKQIENAGGRVIEHKMPIGGYLYSYCKDTEGNVISLMESQER